ncbi:MAG: YceI family protein [Saprospiraceae bacterium]|jgi:polyisoprenoid-binding protein YceI|nr:YceI family protein [Saprospiraceae bacterium]
MKYKLLFFLFFASSFLFAQENFRVTNFSLAIQGTSNLHDWESTAKTMNGTGSMQTEGGKLKAIQSLYVEIPVKSIKSTKGSIMDGKTYDALKSGSNPNIIFKLERVSGLTQSGGNYDIKATGSLTIAGASKQIDLNVRGTQNGAGSFTFSGSKSLKMTDFNIKPPTALFGTLTTGDDVKIVFSVTLGK